MWVFHITALNLFRSEGGSKPGYSGVVARKQGNIAIAINTRATVA
jgi:hypothetical protein